MDNYRDLAQRIAMKEARANAEGMTSVHSPEILQLAAGVIQQAAYITHLEREIREWHAFSSEEARRAIDEALR
jgi:hypothetical protein